MLFAKTGSIFTSFYKELLSQFFVSLVTGTDNLHNFYII